MLEIKELRALTGLSQSKFAAKYQLNIKTLQKWEQGLIATPKHYLFAMNELLKYEGFFYERAEKS